MSQGKNLHNVRIASERLATDEDAIVHVVAPGFGNVCCSFCCLFTGFSGVLLLGLFALCMRFQWFFEKEYVLHTTPEERDALYNAQAAAFGIGALLELIIGIASVFWVRNVL